MTTGERIRTRPKQFGMSVDDLADALDTIPDELMDWGSLLASGIEHQDKMQEVLPLITV